MTIYECLKPGQIALTFDDGPFSYTQQLLNTLAAQNMTATFFINAASGGKGDIGNPSSQYHQVIKSMFAAGHQIASHTFTHQNLTDMGHDYRMEQMLKNEASIANIIGVIPTYMRPPYLDCDAGCLADMHTLGYHVVRSQFYLVFLLYHFVILKLEKLTTLGGSQS